MRDFHCPMRMKEREKVALQFILGGAGSGKTRYLYETAIRESMEHPDTQYLVVVPEQFTMQTQKEIIRLHPRHGVMNIDILSFKRLAYRVFENLGVSLPVVLDDMGKSMVIRKVAGMKRSKLGLYGHHLEQSGFINQLKSQISELYQYGITPDMLRDVMREAGSPLLKQKLEDLELIYSGFRQYIEEHYITAEEILDILCRELPKWEVLKDSVILLDGFTGFTPVQYRLVELFLLHARKVLCSVTIDPRANAYQEGSIQHLFYMGKHTVCRLDYMARHHGIAKEPDVICSRRPAWRFLESPDLDFMEQNLYRYYGNVWDRPADHVVIYKSRGPAGEAAYVCSRIEQMVQEEGLRYRDAAVITGDLASYGRELAHQFDEAGIPYFLDDKKSIMENPLVELIRAALETIRDFSYESVFRYLKTGLVYDRAEDGDVPGMKDVLGTGDMPGLGNMPGAKDMSGLGNVPGAGDVSEAGDVLDFGNLRSLENAGQPEDAVEFDGSREHAGLMTDRLENYVRALGIRGWKRWESQWEKPCRGGEKLNLKELNAYRQWILKPLRPLREAFKEEATIGSVTAALREYLERMGLRGKLEDYSGFFRGRGNPGDENLAREYSQVYDRVLELFERLEGLLGAEKTDMKNYPQILDAGFGEIKVGVIPATIDQVMVGDITRSRLEDVKVLFFVGVNEGTVPQRKSGASLLTDRDRAVFKEFNMELAPTAREDGCIQKFYLYLMMAKPSRRLVLTYAGMSSEGKSQRPSSLIGEVEKLFPGIAVQDEQSVDWPVRTVRDGREMLIDGLRKLREEKEGEHAKAPEGRDAEENAFMELYRYFYCSDEHREKVRQLVDAAFYSYEERGIGRAAARALYGQSLQGSVTRLEQFASCAYAHFLKYGLELMERQEYELEAVDMGNLFHQSIDRCFAVMKERGQDWRGLTEEGRKQLVKECVARVTEEYGNTIMASSARNAYLAGRVERITDRTIWALAEQVKKGDFEPTGFEVSFSAIDNLKAMRISLSEDEELQLRGRIDRLDLCEDEQHVYVKIIDYKSGTTSFDLAALYYGLQLQLVVYMDAAVEMEERNHPDKEVVPAGIFYYHINDPLADKQEGMTVEEIEKQILRQLRMNGLVNSELDIINHLDRDIQKESDVIPVAIKDGYVQESRSSVASTRRFEDLRRFVNHKLQEAGKDILKGNIGLKPYKQASRTACDYCPYHAVCGFDTKTAGYGYRRLAGLKPEDIWAQISPVEEEENDGSKMD
ncbi:PD-(D/E)XK nuclease family protein [Lachnoclostridium pacaense]|uniref:PD-(D/E)XK nuclease family protein n=1 Tax=Enterocloster hominis (ex Hitch et al. 2024) TaxID=1917870 RepID=UPI001D1113B9|nr:PD-(D/E)XK nuclease family protein [Lachnoclostridium pacaense]MCC2818751.1 PD-(D/E)XK nuclease family protein [Lachnoclostridium pacaense]